LLKPVLLLLIAETQSFLVPAKLIDLLERLEAAGREEAARALRADAILRGIGADTPESITSLVQHFEGAFLRSSGAVGVGEEEDGGGGGVAELERLSELDLHPHPSGEKTTSSSPRYSLEITRADGYPIVPPPSTGFSTVKELGSWMEEEVRAGNAKAREALERLKADGSDCSATSTTAGSTLPSSLRGFNKRDMQAVMRWMKIADDALPPSTASMWNALKESMELYAGVVEKRSAVLDECSELTKANAELKTLLSRYCATSKARALKVHPAYTLRLGPATAGEVSTIAQEAMATGEATSFKGGRSMALRGLAGSTGPGVGHSRKPLHARPLLDRKSSSLGGEASLQIAGQGTNI